MSLFLFKCNTLTCLLTYNSHKLPRFSLFTVNQLNFAANGRGVFFNELRKEGGRGSGGPASHTRPFPSTPLPGEHGEIFYLYETKGS